MISYRYWKSEKNRKWYFHARAANYEIIAQGDPTGYHNKKDCLHAIDLLKQSGEANVQEITDPRSRSKILEKQKERGK